MRKRVGALAGLAGVALIVVWLIKLGRERSPELAVGVANLILLVFLTVGALAFLDGIGKGRR